MEISIKTHDEFREDRVIIEIAGTGEIAKLRNQLSVAENVSDQLSNTVRELSEEIAELRQRLSTKVAIIDRLGSTAEKRADMADTILKITRVINSPMLNRPLQTDWTSEHVRSMYTALQRIKEILEGVDTPDDPSPESATSE